MSIVIRGDTHYWEIPLVQTSNGQPYPLNGMAVWVTVKTSTDENDEQALYQHFIQLDLEGNVIASTGMTVKDDDPALGVVVQKLTPQESASFAEGTYFYDLQVMLPNGDIVTLVNGEIEQVVPDYTRAIEPPGGSA